MNKNNVSLLVLFFLFTSVLILGCDKSDQSDMQSDSAKKAVDSTLIRLDSVDVATLDLNNDGKVYQCPMHFNVISDKAETCPECKMDLEEVSVADAQNNLKKDDSGHNSQMH